MVRISEGPELDRAVAEAIGLVCTHLVLSSGLQLFSDPRDPQAGVRTFQPSTDWNDMFEAAEMAGLFTVVRDGPEVHLAKTIDGQWEILTGGSDMGYIAREATPALAICAAILKVLENKGEDIKNKYMDDLYRFQLSTREEKQDATEEWCRAKLAKENANPEAVANDDQKPELGT